MKRLCKKYHIYLFISILVFTSGCYKETDTQHPQITFESPYENQPFTVFDTIPVEAFITDDNTILSVSIKVVDSTFLPVLPTVSLNPGGNEYNLKIEYPIDDFYLNSGDYYVKIRAEDGVNFKNKYQKIYIEAIPKELERIIVLTNKSQDIVEVLEIGQNTFTTSLFEVSGDFVASEITSRYKQLYIAGANQININAYDLKTNQLEWSYDPEPPLPMHEFNCLYYDQYLYSSFSYLKIFGYDSFGAKKFNAQISEAGLPSRLSIFENLLLVDVQSSTGGLTYVYTFYKGTGSQKQRIQTTFKVVEFFALDENNVLIVANEAGHGALKLYNPFDNALNELNSINEGILCSEKINGNEYLIGTESGIVLYKYDQSTVTNILTGKITHRLHYDDLSTSVFLVTENLIEKRKYPAMVLENTFTFSDTILDFHLLYNK